MSDLGRFSDVILNTDNLYKYTIIRHQDGVYSLVGYHYIQGNWSRDGDTIRFNTIAELTAKLIELESK